jgi:hypothetical protein
MRNLRLIESAEPLFDPPRGRPGDWSEPLTLDSLGAEKLDHAAQALKVEPDLLAALLVEHALLLRDLVEARVDVDRARDHLNREASALATSPGPGRLLATYVRDLRRGARPSSRGQGPQVLIPLRLHDEAVVVAHRLCVSDAAEALRFEIAAASSGKLMREWALQVALRVFAS